MIYLLGLWFTDLTRFLSHSSVYFLECSDFVVDFILDESVTFKISGDADIFYFFAFQKKVYWWGSD